MSRKKYDFNLIYRKTKISSFSRSEPPEVHRIETSRARVGAIVSVLQEWDHETSAFFVARRILEALEALETAGASEKS
jgi:hypothetical protein